MNDDTDEMEVYVLEGKIRFMAYDIDHAMIVLAAKFADMAANMKDAKPITLAGTDFQIRAEKPK